MSKYHQPTVEQVAITATRESADRLDPRYHNYDFVLSIAINGEERISGIFSLDANTITRRGFDNIIDRLIEQFKHHLKENDFHIGE